MPISTNNIRYSNMDDVSIIELLEIAKVTGVSIENLADDDVVIFEDISGLKDWVYSDADYTELRQLINQSIKDDEPIIDSMKSMYDIKTLENGYYFKYYG